MDIFLLMGTLIAAAVMGNQVNYHIGRFIGPKVFQWDDSRFFNKAALKRRMPSTKAWRQGGRDLRFPATLSHLRALCRRGRDDGLCHLHLFNIAGAALWVVSLSLVGYWFGNEPWVKQNLSAVIVGIIVVSLIRW